MGVLAGPFRDLAINVSVAINMQARAAIRTLPSVFSPLPLRG